MLGVFVDNGRSQGPSATPDIECCDENLYALTTDERIALMLVKSQGLSLRAISRHLGRHASSLSRELKRNHTHNRYDAVQACTLARQRRSKPRRPRRLLLGSELFQGIAKMLRRGWSPQQIAARLKQQWPDIPELQVSHESPGNVRLSP